MTYLGLKLFASNTHLVSDAQQLLEEGVFSHIELYVPPCTYVNNIHRWQECACEYVIHAPHWGHGINFSDPELVKSNRVYMEDAQRFADSLRAQYIIVHGGFGSTIEEVVRQLSALQEPRLAIENVPCHGCDGQKTTVNTPEHVAMLLREGAVQHSVLDVGHAIYAANALSVAWETLVEAYVELHPQLFHLSDGDIHASADVHKSIGVGTFDLKKILRYLPHHARITLETPRLDAYSLTEAKEDAQRLMQYI